MTINNVEIHVILYVCVSLHIKIVDRWMVYLKDVVISLTFDLRNCVGKCRILILCNKLGV